MIWRITQATYTSMFLLRQRPLEDLYQKDAKSTTLTRSALTIDQKTS